MRDVGPFSNELEFGLYGVDAAKIIAGYGSSLVHEVNPRDVVELNVSMAPDIATLNQRLYEDVGRLTDTAKAAGGIVYGGSSIFSDVSGVEPKRYRTTSASESLARGFLDIASQQIVIGMPDAGMGFELYRLFRGASPALLALTASSPYSISGDAVLDTDNASRRMEQYKKLCRFLPAGMWQEMPELNSLAEHRAWMQNVSGQLKEKLEGGLMDANWKELRKVRSNGNGCYSYYPFDTLEPHQVYCFIRIRPDHRTLERGGNSLFSLELRAPDMPTTRERMQMLNAMVIGLAYYAADHGTGAIPQPYSGSFQELEIAARRGLDAEINGVPARNAIGELRQFAAKGLEERGYRPVDGFDLTERVLTEGNDADIIRHAGIHSAGGIRSYLAERLACGEKA